MTAKKRYLLTVAAVLVFFGLILNLPALSGDSAIAGAKISEGVGLGISVLIMSCIGLAYRKDKPKGFMVAAVIISALLIIQRFALPIS
ncbi:hypothetical protein CLN94_10465 [Pseudothioclava arenosa]|uniref:Uncharacterized protein n=2 Tax=Pseudothioclava arenosa TaxID=1795308 RepID=A0A2A4CQ25_9RHOB|nr:hypothetical protein CLN94_10465 [Pseudothioclava arenosa]